MNNSNAYQVIVTTSNKSMWTIQAFAHLFNQYYSSMKDVYVLCESLPKFNLPPNFVPKLAALNGNKFVWPKDQWSDGLIKYLHTVKERYVLLMLDDYWLIRTVDVSGIGTLLEYMVNNPKILRMDLTADRQFAGGAKRVESYGHYDIVHAPGTPYQMSLMPGMWNKKLLLEILQPGWSPWEVELDGTGKLNETDMIVVGTQQQPIRIVNSLRNDRDWVDIEGLVEPHLTHLKEKGFLDFPGK